MSVKPLSIRAANLSPGKTPGQATRVNTLDLRFIAYNLANRL